MKLLEVSKGAFKYYRENVQGNEHTSYSQVQRKLTRNMLLAHKFVQKDDNNTVLYQYGSMKMLAVNNKIIWIRNRCKKLDKSIWQLDMKKYKELSEQLGIEDYDSMLDKLKRSFIIKTKQNINKAKRFLDINKINNNRNEVKSL